MKMSAGISEGPALYFRERPVGARFILLYWDELISQLNLSVFSKGFCEVLRNFRNFLGNQFSCGNNSSYFQLSTLTILKKKLFCGKRIKQSFI